MLQFFSDSSHLHLGFFEILKLFWLMGSGRPRCTTVLKSIPDMTYKVFGGTFNITEL